MAPNTENIKKWVDALRSGAYEQGQGALATPNGDSVKYCCLGVACEISGVATKEVLNTSEGVAYRIRYDSEGSLLPLAVSDWLGLDESNPTIGGEALTAHNDGAHEGCPYGDCGQKVIRAKTFVEIADLIEEAYLR